MTDRPDMRVWWTAADLAAAALPDLPDTVRGINALADRQGWRGQTGMARRAKVRGGGWEYHVAVLPARAQAKLASLGKVAAAPEAEANRPDRETAWAAFERLPTSVQAEARARLAGLDRVDLLTLGGMRRAAAITAVAAEIDVSERTLWSWAKLVEGVDLTDRLAYLAPQHRLAARDTRRAAWDKPAWDAFYRDFMRTAQPSFHDCWKRMAKEAAKHNWAIPQERTARRLWDAEVPRSLQVLKREGEEAAKRLYPAQERDKTHLHALEWITADGHKWDVMVAWPVPGGFKTIRPVMVAFQDIYSGLILSWRVDMTENRVPTLLALGDVVEKYGIPGTCYMDNGRNFTSKWLSAGARHRFRGARKGSGVAETAPAPDGVLVELGVQVRFTKPYSGQSKPIERTFRDLAQTVAKHPAFQGAYCGNSPMTKPEDFAGKPVDLDTFMAVVAEGIAEHNAEAGRRSAVCDGRSKQAAFDASYQMAPITRATEAQRRQLLLVGELLTGAREDGSITLHGNRYWAEWCPDRVAGKRITVRFDPEAMHAGVHVYEPGGEYLGLADCVDAAGFDSRSDGQAHNRARADYKRGLKIADRAMADMTALEMQKLYRPDPQPDLAPPAPRLVRGLFGAGGTARQIAPQTDTAASPDWDARHARGVALVYRRDE